MKTAALFFLSAAVLMFGAGPVLSHCEIPCGIYDDPMRIEMIAEDITTIEKSMKKIVELSSEKEKNYNQIVRWVENKDRHADRVQHVVSQYFMTQRIKPAEPADAKGRKKYLKNLTLLHEMLVYAMKAKQGADLGNVKKLRDLLTGFQASYFGEPGAAQ